MFRGSDDPLILPSSRRDEVYHFDWSADMCGSDLNWRQPIYVDVRDDAVRKVCGNKRDIFQAIEVTLSRRHDGLRLVFDEVVHDRKIMGSEIPDHVDIMLKQPQISPC